MKPGVLARIRSFKLRIALLSTLLSGAVLVVFGSLTLASVQRINLQDIDKDIFQRVLKAGFSALAFTTDT